MSEVNVSVDRSGQSNEFVNVRVVRSGWNSENYNFDLVLDQEFSSIVDVQPGKVTFTGYGDIRAVYLVFSIPRLGLRKEIGSGEFAEIQARLDTTLFSWGKKVQSAIETAKKDEKKELAKAKAEDAIAEREALGEILWTQVERSKVRDIFSVAPGLRAIPSAFNMPRPIGETPPPKPVPKTMEWLEPKISWLQKMCGQSKAITEAARQEYEKKAQDAERAYGLAVSAHNLKIKDINNKFKEKLSKFEKAKSKYDHEIDTIKKHNLKAKEDWQHTISRWRKNDPKAIPEVVTALLASLSLDDPFSDKFDLEYQAEQRMLVVDYQLPAPSGMPDLKSCRYVVSTDEIKETKITKTALKELYEAVCYQISLAVVHSIYSIDNSDSISAVAFNGIVDYRDPATGADRSATILSAVFDKETFTAIDFAHVDPKSCFKRFKGVSASNLLGLAPIAPIVHLNTSDKRFIDGRVGLASSAEGENVAAMHWEDFEHLIREVFEKEFASRGAEVKITKGSSDGGVDAVVFDPDPIMGGKIVIQAKRYTNVVDLSAVRDLYGTVLNEGASKGILITTSDFGPDAYKFASDKPITLLNGSNLLHMLEKQGIHATIDIADARKVLGLS